MPITYYLRSWYYRSTCWFWGVLCAWLGISDTPPSTPPVALLPAPANVCQRCHSARLITIVAHQPNVYAPSLPPDEDWVLCLNCGQTQGNFPKLFSTIQPETEAHE
jgi:hypothetical protein